MRRNVGCSVLRNPSLRGVARPAPIVLVVACVVLTARDALDTITAYYTWTPQSGELFGWDLPPLVVVSQILSYSFVPWLGAPLSLLVRLRRELPPRMQQQLIVRGVPEGGLMCALVRAALLHALLFWIPCAVLAVALSLPSCHGSFSSAYIELLNEAGMMLPPDPLPLSCAVLILVTVIPPALSALAVLTAMQVIGRFSVACAVVPVTYLVGAFLPDAMRVIAPQFSPAFDLLAMCFSSFNSFAVTYGAAVEFMASLLTGLARAVLLAGILISVSTRFNRAIVRRRLR